MKDRIAFFNWDGMGIGAIWQNISWLYSQEKENMQFDFYLDDFNTKKFLMIIDNLSKPKYRIKINHKEVIHKNSKFNGSKNWREACDDQYKILLDKGYEEHQIQRLPSNLHHRYWPIKYDIVQKDYVCLYHRHILDIDKPVDPVFDEPRLFNQKQLLQIEDLLHRNNIPYEILGLPNDFSDDCKLVSECKYVIGREGGWTHVSHSARKKYMAIIKKPNFVFKFAHKCYEELEQERTIKELEEWMHH